MFTVYDVKAEAFLQPFFANSTGLAIRMFSSAVNDPEHQFAKFASDFTLFELGTFDEATCEIKTTVPPVPLGLALTYKETYTESDDGEG